MAVTDPSTTYEVERAPKRGLFDLPVALLLAMRPRQWSKNLFVYAALIFTNNIPISLGDHARWHNFLITTLGFALYCLLSGGVYLMNDVADREQDRLHPEKCKRPVASGRLPWRVALIAGVAFGVGGTIASFAINRNFGLLALGYYLLQIAYTFAIKHIVLLDVFAIAAGFVFRAVAGALAINVAISVWLLVCTLQLALFLGFGKRRHELLSLEENAVNHRQILSQYSVPFLDQMISIVLGTLTVSYALYTISSETAKAHPGLVVTLPIVMYGIFRYLYLIHMEHKGGSPETILKEDRPLQWTLLLWTVAVIASFKFG
jgi:4-hydroxybenzoate polyprenyltransferase